MFFLVVGSSLVVHPAASLPTYSYEKGGDLVILNIGETPLDHIATFKVEEKVGPTLQAILKNIKVQ